jgi:hypothetical protein
VTRMRPYFASPASGTRAIKLLFIAEMALSPVVAGIAYHVSAAAHGEVFKYVPAIFWLVIFVQCLFTFRWRGLWFLLGPPVAAFAIVAFLVAAPPVPLRSSVPDEASTDSPGKPMVTPNPDGTFTVQKAPPSGNSNDAKNGLVIPPQVVVPMVRALEKK